jgi:hypothetical protein
MFLQSIAAKPVKKITDHDINMIIAILKYARDDAELQILALHVIKTFSRSEQDVANAKKFSAIIINRGVMFSILDCLMNNFQMLNEHSEQIDMGTLKFKRWFIQQKSLFEASASAMHSICLHIQKGQVLSRFTALMQCDAIDFICDSFSRSKKIFKEAAVFSSNMHLQSTELTFFYPSYLHFIWAILNLCYINPDNQLYVVDSKNVQEVILDAMMLYPEILEIQEKCCGALRNISDCSSNRPFIAKSKVFELVLFDMHRFLGSITLQINSMAILRCLSFQDNFHEIVTGMGSLNQIFESLSRHRSNSMLAEYALPCITKLIDECK